LSYRFVNRAGVIPIAAGILLTAACGSSGTRPAPEPEAGIPVQADAAVPEQTVLAGADDSLLPAEPVPEAAQIAYSRALQAMSEGRLLDAQIELQQLTVDYPMLAGPHVNLAIIYRKDGRTEEAEAALESALTIDPLHAPANSELGILHRQRGEFEAAEAAYRRAIEGDPGYALAHYNLGVLLDLYMKREAEALGHYETYQRLASAPDEMVGRWIVDLRRRLGLPQETEQVALENGT
jgi:Tfp pilus assembly protein PilF